MKNSLQAIVEQLHHIGFRRLLVLSGEHEWVTTQLQEYQGFLAGDWLCLSPELPNSIQPEKAQLLLGREFVHGIFDARKGLHSEALAILAGTLKAGSLLVLCTPPQSLWAQQNDADSVRWNEQFGEIPTPNFVHHLQRTFQNLPDVLFVDQQREEENQPGVLNLLPDHPKWIAPNGQPTQQQQDALGQLLSAKNGVWGLIAPRGRGKSTVAGMLIKEWKGVCWCCAPAKVTTGVIAEYAEHELKFWAPDALLHYCQSGQKIDADWLIIDEAAAIPSHILRQIIAFFPRVLMTTTVEGYEGSGRGFMMKFCDSLENFTSLSLTQPIRFAEHDPLERVINQSLLLESAISVNVVSEPIILKSLSQQLLAHDLKQLHAFYGLLTAAHYRTSPLDLRRLLDAQHQHFAVASHHNQDVIGAVWMVDEGDLDEKLSWQIWAGQRRPRGNLVAQSLAAHCYFPQAPRLRSRRVMRIAVNAGYRRQKIGYRLLESQIEQGIQDGLDFLSVSFGLTPELLAFWQSSGFQIVRIGRHVEASSGCFTAMAILPLSAEAQSICYLGQQRLERDLFWRHDLNEFSLKSTFEQHLDAGDWLELVGFSDYHRSLAASEPSLQRFLAILQQQHSAEITGSALGAYFHQGQSVEHIAGQLGLVGQKQWLKRARAEVAQWLNVYYPEEVKSLRQQISVFCL
ncbi:tRNA(Met) cytidine acetyltransferase [Providencia sp. JGM181]|uniref:tRNA(Met) cytidine acetyltransferase TmcA n=1 Tax=unclassified Providencia TaxID=2633465 RepID=UPI001BA482B7|nr:MULTISPECIES: GNAT family N-acetyltransferase [unclassified Providencia]MBS0923818.1 tRNA(Met) cytidine acetyltransferase [Providencia sp. JGM181]MBS0932761.1 tRNA(Met) cytidine acetyltransferase [Providencia sp. JGM172]MBS0996954.1 tRNA(Met) cytidine acetyltransferase [Providencia sp. JGM178]